MGGIKDESHSGTVPLCHREPSVHGEQKEERKKKPYGIINPN